MNIIFIDYDDKFKNKIEKYIYKLFGMYIRKDEKIYYLSINPKFKNFKLLHWFLKFKFKKDKIHVLLSKKIDSDFKSTLMKLNNNIVIITEQNNLIFNDKIYIDRYLKNKKLEKQKSSILFVIDKLDTIIKNKIIGFIDEYKTIDILTYGKALYFDTKDFVDKINEEYGTTIETLDKRPKKNYNILLVFRDEDIEISKESSFVLDYNNSDLDVESNTYKVYLKNKDDIEHIFSRLNMNIFNFEKTKLGKLYIHKEWNTLDK